MNIGPDFREEHTLRDGTRVVLRLIQPQDREELARGIRSMSAESRYRRFFAAGVEPTEEQLRYLCEVDGHDHFAVVAVTESLDMKDERGVGVARFVRIKGEPEAAEAAVTVIDDMQGRGLGTLMLAVLATAAWERGIRRFRGEILADNAPMRKFLHDIGATIKDDGEGALVFDVPLDDGASARVPESAVRRMLRAAAESMAHMIRWMGPREH